MTVRRVLGLAALLTGAGALATCGGDPQEPTPGWVNVTVTTPNADDGGIAFTVTGPAVDSVRSSFPNTFVRRESATQVRAVVIGTFGDGAVVAQVLVPDTGSLSGYTVTVTEVAARAPSFAQQAVAGYALTVENTP